MFSMTMYRHNELKKLHNDRWKTSSTDKLVVLTLINNDKIK